MPLSRTRSLLANINGATSSTTSEAYLPHISENSNHLPQLKNQNGDGMKSNQISGEQRILDDSTIQNLQNLNLHVSNQSNRQNQQSLPSVRPVNSDSPKMNRSSPKPTSTLSTPEQILKLFPTKLVPYEHQEILNYPTIYFIGSKAKKRNSDVNAPNNCGYDNEQGAYLHVTHDHIAYRYEVVRVIGRGSFGQVVKVYDHKNLQYVALKMVRNERRFHKQAEEEIKILEHLRKQDKDNTMNIVHILDSFEFRNHMCITFELLSINLYELIKRNQFEGFSIQLVRRFCHSLLHCLDALYVNRIIHCDMKPENVLLKQISKSGIKANFGSSCYEHQRVYTYIQSRFYRAPEVILGARYGMPIDMWSLGCILVELLTGYPLFPGEDEYDQLACIIELLGMPPKSLIQNSKRAKYFFNSTGNPRYCCITVLEDGTNVVGGGLSRRGKARGPPGSKTLTHALKGCDDEVFQDFILKCLEWDPNKRMTPEVGLRHPWLKRRLPPAPQTSMSSGSGQTSNYNDNRIISSTSTKEEKSSNHSSGAVKISSSSTSTATAVPKANEKASNNASGAAKASSSSMTSTDAAVRVAQNNLITPSSQGSKKNSEESRHSHHASAKASS
ncbi:hypothetical protein J437_LFUL008775, partial [Ladona fulva]